MSPDERSLEPIAGVTPPEGGWSLALPRGGQWVLDGPPQVMGVLNITPDSFSDGGRFLAPAAAISHGLAMLEAGADLLDLGAESTRPGGGVYGDGAREVPVEEELSRLLPVLEGLRAETDRPLAADTRKGAVARACLDAGADLINDVGGLGDPELRSAVADAGCPVVVMHARGELSNMQRGIHFEDAAAEVAVELEESLQLGLESGISREQMILDPGIGFGKGLEHNLALLGQLDRLAALGRPLLVGASRKSFIAAVDPAPPERRLGGSLAALAWAAHFGAAIVRVHDVEESVQFLRVWNAIHLAG